MDCSSTSTPCREKTRCSVEGISMPQTVLFSAERLSLLWNKAYYIGAGLQNLGHNCFVNTALQCLTYTAPLANFMLSQEHSKTCKEPGFCMLCTMEHHINEVFANSGNIITPIRVLSQLKWIGNNFSVSSPGDPHQFLQHIVHAMHNSFLYRNELDRPTQETTFIHQVFGGYLRSRVTCFNCQAVFDSFHPFWDLAVDVNLKTVTSVSKALEECVKPEQLNAYNCTKCEKRVPASNRLTIHRGSNVLIIQLKRADYNQRVRFSEHLDLRPFMSQSHGEPHLYQLYAVSVHIGRSRRGGHIYCYVKASDDQWYRMDDSSVLISDIRAVLKKQAYMLFYKHTEKVNIRQPTHFDRYHWDRSQKIYYAFHPSTTSEKRRARKRQDSANGTCDVDSCERPKKRRRVTSAMEDDKIETTQPSTTAPARVPGRAGNGVTRTTTTDPRRIGGHTTDV